MSERDQEYHGQGSLDAPPGPAGGERPEPAPEIRRPRGSAWRRLEAEGVVWEGQVVLIGEEVDLAARLIVTRRRVAFVREGSVVLTPVRGRARVTLATARWTFASSAALAFLSGTRPFLSLVLTDFRISFGR